jgi:hypothetical protein
MSATAAATAAALVASASISLAADWPQYMGPDRNSTSREKGPRRSWPEKDLIGSLIRGR